MGGFYTLNDILTSIAEGKMQSFMEGDSWAVTKIVNFPRARLLEIMVALGNLDEACRRRCMIRSSISPARMTSA